MFKEMGQFFSLMRNLPKLKEEAEKLQQTLAQLTAEGDAGAGMVRVRINGKMEVLACQISDEAMKLGDREMLEDLIRSATNQALEKIRRLTAEETTKMATGLGLPAGVDLPVLRLGSDLVTPPRVRYRGGSGNRLVRNSKRRHAPLDAPHALGCFSPRNAESGLKRGSTMRLDTTLLHRQELKLVLAPRMIQSMEILQLPIMALQERIQQELQENPVLELKENSEDTVEPEPAPAEAEPTSPDSRELVIEDNGTNAEDFDRLESLNRDWEDIFNEEHRPSRNGIDEEMDRKHDAMQNMASRPQSLQDYLTEQLGYLDAPPAKTALLKHVIAHIDDNGFLSIFDESDPEYLKLLKDPDYKPERPIHRRPPTMEEIASSFDQSVTPEEVEEALRHVQQLDPPGIGARDLKECLLLQVTNDTPHRDIVRVLIQNHLEDIKHNRLPAIQRRTGFDLEAIKEAIEELRRLNPRPGSSFAAEHAPYVVPDIEVFRTESGDYEVRLLDDWLPNIGISRRYYELYKEKGGDPKTKEYLKRKIQAAQWLQDSIAQRRSTLEKVTRAIIQHQRAFLDKGPEHIQPLKMQQIADQVGVHVTTVSRAVDDKWVQTPRGIFPLKRFFGGGKANASGEEVAWEVIKQKLLEFINQEDKENPLSDEELVAKFSEAGYDVARRTVTKYRKMLDIPSSRERKEWVE